MILARPLLSLLLAAAGCLAAAPAVAQNIENGRVQYDAFCRSCHGFPPAGGPERAAGSPGTINSAINGGVPAMSFLRSVVSAQDIIDIAAWLQSLSSPPPAPAVPAFDYTDLWWGGPSESGWGLNLIQHPSNKVFGVMYTYEPDGRAAWYVLPDGLWSSSTLYSGAFYRVTGPHFGLTPFNRNAVRVTQVGVATLVFADRDVGTFTFSIDGTQVTKTIVRQPF